ncbi:tRNA-dihydrouridine synthase [Isoptericola sp. NEAU-Y5]|uniref:tRNA-dihydrouridine synthase n=1 Tax=Isoptericola luteus TaxID=2879484 RepID=A0ABS7ZF35_9MICO|nr:tRNA-dihydrouridine synthase [Isoptericola sp. NEAU-Y5]MCA5893640.1 tRNA-dihydrouridine synthase [Isoptericola sp. NEAU-Y5]
MTHPVRRMRSASVTLGVTAVVAASLTGCTSQSADNRAICVDPETQLRVDDDECDEDDDYHGSGTPSSGFYWYYLRSGGRAPAVGASYATGTGSFDSSRLSGSSSKGGVSSDGGTISRGGFGGSGHVGS